VLQLPSALERVVMAAAKAKASRHAVTPQLRPQDKVSLPVASFVALSGRDETNEVRMSLPVIAPSQHHRQNRQRPSRSAVTDEIGSLPLKVKLRIARK